MTVSEALRRVQRALGRLVGGQGRIARRNARAAFSRALSHLRRAVDRDYPPIRPEPKPVKPTTRDQREARAVKRIARRGYVSVRDLDHNARGVVAACAVVGIRVRRVGRQHWVPEWALDVHEAARNLGRDPVRALRQAKKNRTYRAAMAEAHLLQQEQ